MSYVESFARAMERARASVSYWDHKTLDHLQAAHDAEMRQCSKSEYHRGFEDGRATRDADQWQLDRARKSVVARLRKVVPSEQHGSHEMLSAICTAISEPVMGWTVGAGELLRDQLIALMGGDTDLAKTDAKVPDSGHVRECPQFPTATYDVLGNERHKVVCRLRGFEPRNGGKPTEEASKLIRCIIGREDCHVACGNDLEEARDRLICLLGGETTNSDAETSAKVIQNGEKYQLATDALDNERNKAVCELRNARDGMSDSMAYNVSRIMYAIDAMPKVGERVCKTIADRLIHLLGGDDETASNDDGTCPIAVQSPSITDELREWMNLVLTADDQAWDIADRIDEQFNRICSQHESVLQQTISETVDEHECEMDELRADYEQAISDITGVERGEGSDLLMPVDVFMHVRDGLRHDVEMWRDRTEDMRKERDELLDRLQAISVLCEQDDG